MLKNILNISEQEKDDLIDHLFSSEVYVIQKIKGTHFRYKYNGREWIITRPGNTRLSFIDRTLMLFYQKIYNKLSNIDTNHLVKSYTYSFRYNHDNNTIYLTYILKNNLEIYDIEKLKKSADILKVSVPQIFFHGILDKEFKDKIDFKNIPSLFNAQIPLIIKFSDLRYSYFIDDVNQKTHNQNDLYYLTIIDFNNFLTQHKFHEYEIQGRREEIIYINLINKLFLSFINKNHSRYVDLEIKKPSFLMNDSFSLNRNNITNAHLNDIFDKHSLYEDIYQIILNAFQKEKKESNKLFNQYNLSSFNTNIKRIQHSVIQIKSENNNYKEQKTFKHLNSKNKNILNWKTNFEYLTRSKVKALDELYKAKNKKIRVILPSTNKLKIVLEALKGYEFVHEVVVNNNTYSTYLSDLDVISETGIDITKDDNLNISSMTFNTYKEIFPESLHKFYKNRN